MYETFFPFEFPVLHVLFILPIKLNDILNTFDRRPESCFYSSLRGRLIKSSLGHILKTGDFNLLFDDLTSIAKK